MEVEVGVGCCSVCRLDYTMPFPSSPFVPSILLLLFFVAAPFSGAVKSFAKVIATTTGKMTQLTVSEWTKGKEGKAELGHAIM